MIFGRTIEQQRLDIMYSARPKKKFAYFPVKLRDGQWLWWDYYFKFYYVDASFRFGRGNNFHIDKELAVWKQHMWDCMDQGVGYYSAMLEYCPEHLKDKLR